MKTMMKTMIYCFALSLVGCDRGGNTGGFEGHVKSKRQEIERIVGEFERSEYRKISYGRPNFITFVGADGSSQELVLNDSSELINGRSSGGEITSKALWYREVFEDAGIIGIEKSLGVYVYFGEGRSLLIVDDDPETVSKHFRGKSSTELYPGWYIFVE